MRDEILKSYISNFQENFGLEDKKEDALFEDFSNYNIISKLYPKEIDIDDLSTGGTDDIGIDGAAIIVNGNVIKDAQDIDFFIKNNGTLKVTFAFIQSKSSSKFNGEQIGTFLFGVKSFFDKTSSIPENKTISNLRKIKEKIYKESIYLEENPTLKLFFVTTGEWKEPKQIVGRVNRELQELNNKNLFNNQADVEFYDAERLKSTYREISRKTIKEIPFNNHISLPDMPEALKVRQSFLGSISAKNYIELITDKDGNLSKGLFYDNVRDFQGSNKVNREIQNTINSEDNQNLLALLNNGITIIAKKVEKIGSKMKLTDFQIVNGCQTSHVLFQNKDNLLSDTHIVIKVIETIDPDVTNKIIRATNRQTEVKDEAFESLKPFHKDLQEYYKAKSVSVNPTIYYERRSKEYINNPSVKSWQIITLASQIKAYVSIQLEQPQSTHRYFGELLDSNANKLFQPNQNLKSYYLTALISNRVERHLKKRPALSKYKPFKYHIALLVYKTLQKQNSSIDDMISTASNLTDITPYILQSQKLIDECLSHPLPSVNKREADRSKDFTATLLSLLPKT